MQALEVHCGLKEEKALNTSSLVNEIICDWDRLQSNVIIITKLQRFSILFELKMQTCNPSLWGENREFSTPIHPSFTRLKGFEI